MAFLYMHRVCIATAAGMTCIPLILIAQRRKLKDLTVLALISATCIFAVLGICLIQLYAQARGSPTILLNQQGDKASSDADFLSKCGAVSAIVFASGMSWHIAS